MGQDYIKPEQAITLHGLFCERVKRTPDANAYRYFDASRDAWLTLTWKQMSGMVARWQGALARENLATGDRVAIMLRNCPQWVAFDQAAMSLGLVVVPLYVDDRPDNIAYIVNDAQIKVLLLENAGQWQDLQSVIPQMPSIQRYVSLHDISVNVSARLQHADTWLPVQAYLQTEHQCNPKALATIMYTSGTTGKPKGVMLSHYNIIHNAYAGLKSFPVKPQDSMLSFLPLSHAFERTAGYYMSMMAGAMVAYARSIALLADDLSIIRPTILISVPRIYERIYNGIHAKLEEATPLRRKLFAVAVHVGWHRFEYLQGRARWSAKLLWWPVLKYLVANKLMHRLGGRLRLSISGGAALSPKVSRLFLALGLPLVQGYGMTETSPVIAVNHVGNNLPHTVGVPLEDIEVRLGEHNALLVKGPGNMLGYWNNPEATAAVLDQDGWLNTGDTVSISPDRFITITGRLKEIIVMSNGEKVPPTDMENAILRDRLFEQVLLYGDGRSYMVAVAVINPQQCEFLSQQPRSDGSLSALLKDPRLEKEVLQRIADQIKAFPGYAKVRRATLLLEPWSVENGLQTPTLKIKRERVFARYAQEIARLYEGH